MLNWNAAGHDNVKKFLEKSLEKGKIANAYLFHGPERVGKTFIANQFVKSLFCNNVKKPCGECVICGQIEKWIYPDVFRVCRLEGKNDIVIEQIRDLKERIYSSSFFSGYKAGIIEEAEFLNDSAWNSLLKVLEEPPNKMVIIIISNNIDMIPETIVSRCQKVRFFYAQESAMNKYLSDCGIPRAVGREAARLAMGRMGIAMEIASDPLWRNRYDHKIADCFALFSKTKNLKEKNDLILKIAKEKKDIYDFFNFLVLLLRDLVLAELYPDLIVNFIYKEKMDSMRNEFDLKKLCLLLEKSLKLKSYLNNNVSGKLLLENFILEIE
ncbi:MAG: DNA polymerase III subunit [bacterium]